MVILLAFLIDMFVFFEIYYMYKAFYLLGISMLIKLFFYMMKDFSSNLSQIEESLIIVPKGYDLETCLPITEYRLKE